MKIAITYPPLSGKGIPLLSQNRQFQWFNDPTFIYPIAPATAATYLKQNGYDVVWLDGIAEQLNYTRWKEMMIQENPDAIAIETKTPVINKHYEIIKDMKVSLPGCKFILMGDHVTAFPEEAFSDCPLDFVITGGDYEFLLNSIAGYMSGKSSQLEPGIYYRESSGSIRNSGKFERKYDLNVLPFIDRELTGWQNYAYHNGNYKKTPGTYIMSGRDCWYHQCTFCSWTTLFPTFNKRTPESVLDEIGELIEKYNVREIMDDTGTFPVGDWLHEFCKGMIERGYNRKVSLDCNMRLGSSINPDEMKLMKKAGFRLVLVGIESANQNTLDRVKKGEKIDEMIEAVKQLHKAGLFPHITIMFGYPWENEADALNTLNLGKYLLTKNFAYTMQATVVIPYPGTPLFDECRERNWLLTENFSHYDMREPVMKTEMGNEKLMKLVQGLYEVSFNPEFIARKLLSIRDFEDVRYFLRAGKKVAGHIFDFKDRKKQ